MKSAVLIAVAGALTLPGTATAQQNPKLLASVGPGFTITLTLADGYGEAVRQVAPGTYDIVVTDRAEVHNFHLTGPGVDQRTEVEFMGSVTWTVTLREGTYTYLCDPHSTQMRGTLTVGQPAAPAPAPAPTAPAKPGRLNASVGPGFTISLKTLAGRVVRSVKAGLYTIVVRDRAAIHNFHLTGRGLNRKTGVPFVGTATWQVRFVKGQTYRFVCDPHKQTMKGSFRAN
jgi:plastocyanin